MTVIQVKDLMVQGNHGLYEGEQKTGNTYQVDLSVQYEEGVASFEKLSSTVNYVELYEIIRQRMDTPAALLEKLCDDIIKRVKRQFPFIKEATISVIKLQAPIENFQGKVGVTLHKVFDE